MHISEWFVGLCDCTDSPCKRELEAAAQFDAEYDSIVQRFDQLEGLLTGVTDLGWEGTKDALVLVKLLREQVLK